MRIALTTTGEDLEGVLDPRFGRARNFIIVNPDTMNWERVENRQNLDLPQGAGIQAGKTLVDNRVDVLITGNCGPKAFQVLQRAGIRVVVGVKGSLRELIAQFTDGQLQCCDSANVEGHWV